MTWPMAKSDKHIFVRINEGTSFFTLYVHYHLSRPLQMHYLYQCRSESLRHLTSYLLCGKNALSAETCFLQNTFLFV